MTKTRRRNQERGLHFVMLQSVDQFGQRDIDQQRGGRNKSAEAPESGVQLTDHSVGLELEQTCQRNLNIHILLNESGVVTARGKKQVTRIDLRGNLAKSVIAIRGAGVEGICAVDVGPGRTDQRPV